MISISQSNEEKRREKKAKSKSKKEESDERHSDKMRNGTLVLLSTLNRFIYVDAHRI